jgi:hypothetical protein
MCRSQSICDSDENLMTGFIVTTLKYFHAILWSWKK